MVGFGVGTAVERVLSFSMDETPFASCRNGRPYTIGQGVVYVSALSKLFVATVSISSIQLVIFNLEIRPFFSNKCFCVLRPEICFSPFNPEKWTSQ